VGKSKRLIAYLSAGLLLAISFWAGTQTSFKEAKIEPNSAPASIISSPVEFKQLFTALSVSGTISSGKSFPVTFGSVEVPGALSIVTSAPPKIGSTVTLGSTLGQVAGMQIYAFEGSEPMYRILHIGSAGTDVTELQESLSMLGYSVLDARGHLGVSTAQAFWEFVSHSGENPAAVDGTSFRQLSIPQWQLIFVPSFPARILVDSLEVGSVPSSPALVLSQGTVAFVGTLTPAQASLSKTGDPMTIQLGSNTASFRSVAEVQGTRLQSTAVQSNALVGESGEAATATITVQSTKSKVLAVPDSALVTGPSGQIGVHAYSHGTESFVAVNIGDDIGGLVAVVPLQPRTLVAGELVVINQ
jgi:peptidoglycan hydrolase-like protein with peptidoglycan-binding domain